MSPRLHTEAYAFFAADRLALHGEVPWLGLAGSLASIPEQVHAERVFARPPRLLVEDLESLGLAVTAGLGVAILPRSLAARLDGVVEVDPAHAGALDAAEVPSRELWLVVHRSKQQLPNVRAVIRWLDEVFSTS